MPGFAISGAGGGSTSKNNRAEYRRKHRWRVTGAPGGTLSQTQFLELKTMQRPSVSFAEVEVHHDQEVAYFAGKTTWEAIEFTFYDSLTNDISGAIYGNWIQNSVNIDGATVMPPQMYKLDLQFSSTDGKGAIDETWTLHGCWVAKANFNDLAYDNTEIQLVNVTVRFDRATRG